MPRRRSLYLESRAMPLVWPLAQKMFIGALARTGGAARFPSPTWRRGEAPPHIRRRSRNNGAHDIEAVTMARMTLKP